jgi:hypothetical protein
VLTEWSINDLDDPRGALRVAVFTEHRRAAGETLAKLVPGAQRYPVDDLEGVGLAFRPGQPASVRWYGLAKDNAALAARLPADPRLDALWAATGGPGTCAAVGLELGASPRTTVYAAVRSPEAFVRVLELAQIPVSQRANLFAKGILGLEPGGRSFPRVWVARSLDTDAWKLYYFARGDDDRRTDEVLLDAVQAGPHLYAAWRILGAPTVQLVALAFARGAEPRWTTYLAVK